MWRQCFKTKLSMQTPSIHDGFYATSSASIINWSCTRSWKRLVSNQPILFLVWHVCFFLTIIYNTLASEFYSYVMPRWSIVSILGTQCKGVRILLSASRSPMQTPSDKITRMVHDVWCANDLIEFLCDIVWKRFQVNTGPIEADGNVVMQRSVSKGRVTAWCSTAV